MQKQTESVTSDPGPGTRTDVNRKLSSKGVAFALDTYAKAKAFADKHFQKEILWQRAACIDDATESDFLREAAWVVFCSGFRERTVRNYFSYLSLCFCDWESAAAIMEHAEACRTAALAGFNNVRKVDAVVEIARRVTRDGFPALKREIVRQPIEVLQTLPYIGPVTVYHLAKNLGLRVAKPDRHLMRLAESLSYPDAHVLCLEIAALTGDPPHVVDLILWRYLVETQSASRLHRPWAEQSVTSIAVASQLHFGD